MANSLHLHLSDLTVVPPTIGSVSTRTAVTTAFVVTESTVRADSVRVKSQTNLAGPCGRAASPWPPPNRRQ